MDELKRRNFFRAPLSKETLAEILRGKVRFHNRKAQYILEARKTFLETTWWSDLKTKCRNWLQLREMSGDARALEDLKQYRDWLISEASPLTKGRYCGIEGAVQEYASKLGLEIDELDQPFWSSATGYVGK